MTEEDRAFFAKNKGLSFLASVEIPEPKRWVNPRKEAKRKRKLAALGDDVEAAYEARSKSKKQVKETQAAERDTSRGLVAKEGALPIKLGNNRLAQAPKRPAQIEIPSATTVRAAITDSDDEGDEVLSDLSSDSGKEDDKKGSDGSGPEEVNMPMSTVEQLEEKKLLIASLASDILADPEGTTSKLRQLRELCSFRAPSIGYSVCKLAIMSMATVFKDIIPGYRIRERTEKEKDVTLSKEVKKLREYEESVLRNYQMYLQRLHALIKNEGLARKAAVREKNPSSDLKQGATLCSTCIKALCFLLVEIPHFNYRSNIIELVVPRMNDKKNLKIANHCCATVSKLFKEDTAFDAAQETVKAMSRVIKASNYTVREEMIKCFFDLKLNETLIRQYIQRQNEDVDQPKSQKGGKHTSRMRKKEDKAHKELDKELREAQIDIDKKALARRQTTILNQLFATYFRVLKHGRRSPLMPIVLQGLAKHTHLIDASFFGDLMSVLREIMGERINSTVTLQSVRTGCMLLSGQAGLAMNIDVKAFHDALYEELLSVANDTEGVSLAMICIRLLLHERREVSIERVAAFMKRIAHVALQFKEHNQTVTALSNLRSMLQRYVKLEVMLDSDNMTQSVYRPDVSEPEHSNPLATPLWELTLLSRHYYPWVQHFSKHIAGGAPSTGANALPPKFARAQPHQLYKNLDPNQFGFSFNPPVKFPKKHPLSKNMPESGSRRSSHINDPGINDGLICEFLGDKDAISRIQSSKSVVGSLSLIHVLKRNKIHGQYVKRAGKLAALKTIIARFEKYSHKNTGRKGKNAVGKKTSKLKKTKKNKSVIRGDNSSSSKIMKEKNRGQVKKKAM